MIKPTKRIRGGGKFPKIVRKNLVPYRFGVKTPSKRGKTGGRTHRIPKHGKSPVSVVKRLIQAQLRENAIKRDKTCVIGQYPQLLPQSYRKCGRLRKDGQIIVQAEHLCGRAKSKSYADMDNIILVCSNHHIFFKRQHPAVYWNIVRFHIGEERWVKVQKWEKDNSVFRQTAEDWRTKLSTLKELSAPTNQTTIEI